MSERIVTTRRFNALVSDERNAQKFLTDQLHQSSMPDTQCNGVRLAVEELFSNIISYAYGSAGGIVDLTVSVDDAARLASVLISDEGKEFDPFSGGRSDAFDSRSGGGTAGLGILLVRRLMDECSYRRVNGRNEVTIVKRWGLASRGVEAVGRAAQSVGEAGSGQFNAPERSQKPLTDDDLALVVGGLTMPDLPFLQPLGK